MNLSSLRCQWLLLMLLNASAGIGYAQAAGQVDTCGRVFAEPLRYTVLLVLGDAAVGQSGNETARGLDGVYSLHPINGLCYPASDPMIGTLGSETAPWVRLGNRLQKSGTIERVLIAPLLTARSEIAEWLPGGPLHSRLLRLLYALDRQGLAPDAVLWQHGAGDTDETAGESAYVEGVQTLLTALRGQGIEAPFLIAARGACPGKPGGTRYAAQRALWEHPTMQPGPDLAALGDTGQGDCGLDEDAMQALVEAWFAALDNAGVLAR